MSWKEVKAKIKEIKDANRELTQKYRDELRAYCKAQKDHEEWTRLPEEEREETPEPIIPDKPTEPTLAELPDWRDTWKYGDKVRGVGNCGGKPCIEWGENISPEEKVLVETLVTTPHKWAQKVEYILDNPPTQEDLELLQRLKPLLD